ncbi:MAG: hypothetical protein M1818_000827 [Claussenomyces sp. TS43310]|nr:MAG: hypothetical protein M1818_000827 [Claussenomyces sp. TS43310]
MKEIRGTSLGLCQFCMDSLAKNNIGAMNGSKSHCHNTLSSTSADSWASAKQAATLAAQRYRWKEKANERDPQLSSGLLQAFHTLPGNTFEPIAQGQAEFHVHADEDASRNSSFASQTMPRQLASPPRKPLPVQSSGYVRFSNPTTQGSRIPSAASRWRLPNASCAKSPMKQSMKRTITTPSDAASEDSWNPNISHVLALTGNDCGYDWAPNSSPVSPVSPLSGGFPVSPISPVSPLSTDSPSQCHFPSPPECHGRVPMQRTTQSNEASRHRHLTHMPSSLGKLNREIQDAEELWLSMASNTHSRAKGR